MVDDMEKAKAEFAALTALRAKRRQDPNWMGCDFCFDTAWGELKDGVIVPCPEHNGLCL